MVKKKDHVYLPDRWMEVIKESRRAKPFEVVKVEQSHILNSEEHFPQLFRKMILLPPNKSLGCSCVGSIAVFTGRRCG